MQTRAINFPLRCILCMALLCSSSSTYAHPPQDTLGKKVLGEGDLLAILRTYHPVIQQAGLYVDRAKAMKTASRSGFDPVLSSYSDRKRLGGDVYYQYYRSDLSIPTWYGIEIQTGIENIFGPRLNPEASVGEYSYLGIRVPVLRDLVMDKRRAALQQASLLVNSSEAERNSLVNDLVYEALTAYWDWVNAYQGFAVIDNAVLANEDRLRFVKLEFLQGNRPAIDTTEALTQLQQFYGMREAAKLQWLNAGIALSAYLWGKDQRPFILPSDIMPDSVSANAMFQLPLPLLEDVLQNARTTHPKLAVLQWKQDILAIERRLKFQGLLPQFDIKANLLNKGYRVTKGLNASLLENNYKLGVDFSVPLRLSQGRGEYRENKFKMAQNKLEMDRQSQLIENKVKAYYNEAIYLRKQVDINKAAVDNFRLLLQGENARFQVGESSLFLINARELKYIEAQQKLIDLRAKLFKSFAGLQWAAGQYR